MQISNVVSINCPETWSAYNGVWLWQCRVECHSIFSRMDKDEFHIMIFYDPLCCLDIIRTVCTNKYRFVHGCLYLIQFRKRIFEFMGNPHPGKGWFLMCLIGVF